MALNQHSNPQTESPRFIVAPPDISGYKGDIWEKPHSYYVKELMSGPNWVQIKNILENPVEPSEDPIMLQGSNYSIRDVHKDLVHSTKQLILVPENSKLPTLEILQEPDGIFFMVSTEDTCIPDSNTYFRREECFNSDGSSLGEIRYLRVSTNDIFLPDPLNKMCGHIQISISLTKNEANFEGRVSGFNESQDLQSKTYPLFNTRRSPTGTNLEVTWANDAVYKEGFYPEYLRHFFNHVFPLMTGSNLQVKEMPQQKGISWT